MIWRYHLVAAQYWVHQVSSACPLNPENDMGLSNSGTEMSIYTSIVQAEADDMEDFKWTSTKYTLSLSIATKVMIKQSWDNVILGISWHQSSGVDLHLLLRTAYLCSEPVHALYDISILL